MRAFSCPLALEMLLHYHCTPEPFPGEEREPQHEILGFFIEHEMLSVNYIPEARYTVTAKGYALIEHILNLEMPVAQWVMP